jgi:hypothetical protein
MAALEGLREPIGGRRARATEKMGKFLERAQQGQVAAGTCPALHPPVRAPVPERRCPARPATSYSPSSPRVLNRPHMITDVLPSRASPAGACESAQRCNMQWSVAVAAWFTPLLNPLVSRVNRRIDMRMVKSVGSTCNVEMCFGFGSPAITSVVVPRLLLRIYRFSAADCFRRPSRASRSRCLRRMRP